MRALAIAVCLSTGCAHVDYDAINARYASQTAALDQRYRTTMDPIFREYREGFLELQRRCREARATFSKGRLTNPMVTPVMHQWVWNCQDLPDCDARVNQVVKSLDARYTWATQDAKLSASQALLDVQPSSRLEAYERILAKSHNAELDQLCATRLDQMTADYRESERKANARYAQETQELDRLRTQEVELETRRVDAENAEVAAAIVGGLAVAAAVAVAASSSSGGGGGYAPAKDKVVCGAYIRDSFQGCCSYHRGINRDASYFRVMCNDGAESPTCECW